MSEPRKIVKVPLSWGAVSFIEAPSSLVLFLSVVLIATSLIVSFTAAFFVKIEVAVKSAGQTDSLSGVKEAVAVTAGQIYHMPTQEGGFVKKDQPIAWIRMEGTHEAQLRELHSQLRLKMADLESKSLTSAQLGVPYPTNMDATLRESISTIERKTAALYNAEFLFSKNTQAQMSPLKRRQKVLAGQLAYIKKSHLRNYLILQREGLEDEQRKLSQQVQALQSEIDSKIFEAKIEAQEAYRLALSAIESFIWRHQVRAPMEGRIARLTVSQGSFVAEHQSIASIIPVDSPIVAKVFIASQDVAKVQVGLPCILSIDAYPSHKFGYFKGVVLNLDKIKSQNGLQSDGFLASVSIDQTRMERRLAFADDVNSKVQLTPGMQVEARIISMRASIASLAIDKIFGKNP